MAQKEKPSKREPITEVEFDYIKSNFFRVVRADGAFGGVAPNGAIHMSIFSERQAIPTKIVQKVVGTKLGEEIREKRQGRKAIVREVEVDVVLELPQAIALKDWLLRHIESRINVDKQRAAAASAAAPKPAKPVRKTNGK